MGKYANIRGGFRRELIYPVGMPGKQLLATRFVIFIDNRGLGPRARRPRQPGELWGSIQALRGVSQAVLMRRIDAPKLQNHAWPSLGQASIPLHCLLRPLLIASIAVKPNKAPSPLGPGLRRSNGRATCS